MCSRLEHKWLCLVTQDISTLKKTRFAFIFALILALFNWRNSGGEGNGDETIANDECTGVGCWKRRVSIIKCQGYPPRELAGDDGLLPGAGPGGSLSSSARTSPSTRSLSMSFSWSFISLLDRKESRFVDIRSLSTLDRSLAPLWR